MGGARFPLVSMEEGVAVVRRAYDLGIDYFAMARSYADGHAEEVYGNAIPPFRKNIFLTTKSGKRTRREAKEDLNLSLKLMKTDHVDLWQMHGVDHMKSSRSSLPAAQARRSRRPRRRANAAFSAVLTAAIPGCKPSLLKHAERFDTALIEEERKSLEARAASTGFAIVKGPALEYWKIR
jgi:aryl-alcohol dehydrogenase-like predicted oxidoreductase